MATPGTSPIALAGELQPSGTLQLGPRGTQIGNIPTSRRWQHPPVIVHFETVPGRREFAPSEIFDWRNITFAMDGGDTTAVITAAPDAAKLTAGGEIGSRHLTHLIELVNPDQRVRIAQTLGTETFVYFQGFPQVPTVNWHPRGQELSCLCVSEGQEILRTSAAAQITGRRMRFDPLSDWNVDAPDDVLISSLLPVFNAGNLPNRSQEPFPFPSGERDQAFLIHLFTEDNAPEARAWSFSDVLRYLTFFHVHKPGLAVSVTDFLADTDTLVGIGGRLGIRDPFERRLSAFVDEVSLVSMNVEQAIHQVTDAAGVHYEIAIRNTLEENGVEVEHHLRVFATLGDPQEADNTPRRRMIAPKVYNIPREAPFTDLSGRTDKAIALANRAQQANLNIDRRATNAPIILGGAKIYEVTLLLRPGWLPHLQLDDLHMTQERCEAAGGTFNPGSGVCTLADGTEVDTVDLQKDAVDFWQKEFRDPYSDEEPTRIPSSIYHSAHPDHAPVNTVGRYWIFPDDWRFITSRTASPFARDNWPAFLYSPFLGAKESGLVLIDSAIGGGILDAGDWVPRRRPLGDTIGRIRQSGDRAPIVRFNFKATDPETALLQSPDWVEYTGLPKIDPLGAGIYILEANMWRAPPVVVDPEDDPYGTDMNMLRAFIEGRFMVSVTCTIMGDDRLVARRIGFGASFSRHRSQVIDTGLERFRFESRRGQNSHLNDLVNYPIDPDPEFEDRNDQDKLEAYLRRETQIISGDTVSGSFDVFWIDRTYRPGDSFSGVDGLGIEFNRFPEIVRIEYLHDTSAGFRTTVHLSDLRDSPEVDGE